MKRTLQWLFPVVLLVLTACQPTTIQGDFKLQAPDLTVTQGQSGAITIAIERDATDTTPIDFVLEQANAQALPTGISGIFSPNPSPGNSSSLNILVGNSVTPQTYALQVKGSIAGGVTRTAAFNLVVQQVSSFDLAIDPVNLSLAREQSATVNVTLTRTNFTNPIDLSVLSADGSALPDGITASLTPSGTGFQILVSNTAVVQIHNLEVKAVGGSITKTTPLFLTVSAPVLTDFTLDLNPSALQVTQGQSGSVAINLTRTNLTGDASISLQGLNGTALPAGITSAGSTISADAGSIQINVAASTAVQSYDLEVKAVIGSVTKIKPVTVNVVAPAVTDFSFTATPATLTLEQGQSGTTTLNVTRSNLTSDITFSLQGVSGAALPAGISATNSTTSTNTSTLNIVVAANTAAQTYSLEIKATSGAISKTTGFNLTVSAKPNFSLSSNLSSLSLEQAQAGTVAITLNRTNLAGTINVSLQGVGGTALPTGIGSSFASSPTGGTLSITVANNASVQPSNLEILAVGGGITKTVPFGLTVTAKPDFSLAVLPTALTIEQTLSDTVSINLTRAGFTGSVTVSLQGAGSTTLPTGINATPIAITTNTGILTIAVSNAAVQNYNLEVKAVGGSITKTTPLTLTVLSAPFAIQTATQTILQWSGIAGDFLSSTTDNPLIASYSTPINAAGVVSYDLPIPTVLTDPATLLSSYCSQTTNLTFTPSTIKGSQRLFGAPNGVNYGSLVLSNQDVKTPAVGLEQAFVVYLDGDLNITGTCTGTQSIANFTVTINAKLKQGWNILVAKVTNITGIVGQFLDIELTSRTTVPSRYAWRYYQK